MNHPEKALARQLFQNKILKADGQIFEDIFTAIMNYVEPDFRSIKPWGNIGDRKNDGYIKTKRIFFQVFAPEDIRKSYIGAIDKLKTDFTALMSQWNPVEEFYFVVNDKYKGVNADCEQAIQDIKKTYHLRKADFLTPKDLENMLFRLDDDQIFMISGNIPDPANIKHLDYSILNEIVGFLMQQPLQKGGGFDIIVPDWNEKIKLNHLSAIVSQLLNHGYYQLHSLNEYLSNNSDFLADSLRNKMNEIYSQEKRTYNGDNLFWAIVNRVSPKAEFMYQSSAIVIMSKYFETCDIFDDPSQEKAK